MNQRRREIGAFAAKTHLARLLREAERGRSYVILRRGRAVARLMPLESGGQDWNPAEILQAFRQLRQRIKGPLDVRKLIEEGRRY